MFLEPSISFQLSFFPPNSKDSINFQPSRLGGGEGRRDVGREGEGRREGWRERGGGGERRANGVYILNLKLNYILDT